jgi:hypothetical protein
VRAEPKTQAALPMSASCSNPARSSRSTRAIRSSSDWVEVMLGHSAWMISSS